jgi:hypothetical protein
VHNKKAWKGVGLLFVAALLLVFLSPPGEPAKAFNQSNLIRVAEVREVDGKVWYTRVAPVTDMQP